MESFGLDLRLIKALEKCSISLPTPIQKDSIPVALQGRDLIIKSRTGSGKTFAYLLPLLQKVLSNPRPFSALILVPTKELARQTAQVITSVCKYCDETIRFLNLSGTDSFQGQRTSLAAEPQIIISTPSRILPHLEGKNLSLKDSLETFVVDEADLVISFGYNDDVKRIMAFLPNYCQNILISATLTAEVERLQALLLKNPHVASGEGFGGNLVSAALEEFSIKCADEKEKFLILYVVFKLRLIKGKCIIFVNSVSASYRLKLFLEQFSIKSCILNPELPLNSRCHIVEEFNRGAYDIVIASDALNAAASDAGKAKKAHDEEFSASRGLDFKQVDCVINFDIPIEHQMYVHRVGRTARGNESGTAFSLFCPEDQEEFDELCLNQKAAGSGIKPYNFDFKQIDAFRYRMEDAFRSVTKIAVHEARLKEIKAELLRSSKLKGHFSNNPADLEALRHDKPIHAAKVQPHMKHVPAYLLSSIGGGVSAKNIEKLVDKRPASSVAATSGTLTGQAMKRGQKDRKEHRAKKNKKQGTTLDRMKVSK
jgi:ATP-dependent RNA helicase DDX56/DBP9